MTVDDVTQLGQQAMYTTLLAAAPMLIAGMVVGLFISVLQSVTQIQEITLTFVPKIVVVMLVFVLFLPFIAETMLSFVQELFMNMDAIVLRR
ncbi:MAG: flagellar biosynthesis protein FliQ [Candidatus Hydrogenedentota bacterium]